MVNYRLKLGVNFDLSEKQIEILERNSDTIVRAVPGSGKTTILTLKIKNLLFDYPSIRQLCCISYTNVNVEDLEASCGKRIKGDYLDKIEFQTFHRFCLQYILNPFSYLYRSKQGFRPYKIIFNFKEHGTLLLNWLVTKKINQDEIDIITRSKSIYYNFKYQEGRWVPFSDGLKTNTLIEYLNFLNNQKIIDFNLINLLSLLILQENEWVKRVLNKSIDWVLIDEFQDVTDIQCRIIEELRRSRKSDDELKWFIVGDPNQSIYGFAGANPRSMFDMKRILNSLGEESFNCEIKLDRTHRCPSKVFNFARTNYNDVLLKVKNLITSRGGYSDDVVCYLEDLEISNEIIGNEKEGDVIIKNTLSGVSEIVNLKFNELVGDDVCCIGITKYNSIDVYKHYKTIAGVDDGTDFKLYSELYKEFEDEYGFKYFSIFVSYLMLKYNFYHDRITYPASVNKFIYYLNQMICEKISDEEEVEKYLLQIIVDSCDLRSALNSQDNIFDEFSKFSKRLSECLIKLFPEHENLFVDIKGAKVKNFEYISTPTVMGFINFVKRINNSKASFEIKHIHKIKGLEYDQVIVQRAEDLPHKSNYKIHNSIFQGQNIHFTKEDVYNYIQEINKLYVMLTRSKCNLYLIINNGKHPALICLDKK